VSGPACKLQLRPGCTECKQQRQAPTWGEAGRGREGGGWEEGARAAAARAAAAREGGCAGREGRLEGSAGAWGLLRLQPAVLPWPMALTHKPQSPVAGADAAQ
jgi:hypothetical protein